MNKEQVFWLLPVHIFLFFSIIKNSVSVNGQCLSDQHSYLLELKNSLNFDLQYSTKFVKWNPEEDCCSWIGVGCDGSGRVTTLELNEEAITGAADNLTSLFRLQFLEKLNLEGNNFNIPIPKAIAKLTNLVYLNLSASGFVGQIPIELSSLRKLVSLDLSTYFFGPLKLESPTLKMLIQNLSNIEEIYLDGVNLSAQGSEWSQVIATSLPKLRILSLQYCHILGPIDTSLSSIHNLSFIRLDGNNISTEVPAFLANMPNLRILGLGGCNLVGQFPVKIFQVPALQTLILSSNKLLKGNLPPFPKNSSLRILVLRSTSFSGFLPNSIGNLHMLSVIVLGDCKFNGTISAAFRDLQKLSHVDLSHNNFSGPIPQLQSLKNLVYMDLSHNSLTGSLSSIHFEGLQSLVILELGHNFLRGSLPSSIFKLPALTTLKLPHNQFSGEIDEVRDTLSISGMQLEYLDLRSNQLNGSFPKFLLELKELRVLALSSNSFTDTIQLEEFKNLPHLTRLELSYNNLVVEPQTNNSTLAGLSMLKLASCKLQSFPDMKGQSRLSYLDLSDNEITGEIPNWIWNLSLNHVNLSFNFFSSLQKPYEISRLTVLDIHSNQLQGEVPNPSTFSIYVDYSSNNFSGPIPPWTGLLHYLSFLSISKNSLSGSIPDSICNAYSLLVLDLSYNYLNGTIPSCLVTRDTLGVLNLAGNNLSGSIPDTFLGNCSLRTLDLAVNHLQGKLPRTLSNCALLEVLNLGYNKIEDVFPCMFEISSSLHVLILRSNKFHGELECFGYNYTWPQLQILDVASNNFSGILSNGLFSSLKKMLTLDFAEEHHIADNLRYTFLDLNNFYYQFKVGVTMKGRATQLEKILTTFTVIDFSNNKLSGNIPESIGDLKLLYVLDLSSNKITGGIPSSIGKMQTLGSLDLSMNHLVGEIPSALNDMNFLSFLNLSFNILTGKIPTGPQFQTFLTDSYMGNVGLCGFPLNVSCGNVNDPGSSSTPSLSNRKEITWIYVSASVGYAVGLGIFSMFLLFCAIWRNKLFHQVDQLMLKVFGKKTDLRIVPEWKEPIKRL